jgi:hypothetical protein
MAKSPIDQLFFDLYGYYPPKAGQAYEMIVAASLKLLLQKDIEYDQRERGSYSETVYQLDGVIKEGDDKSMIEAKDYTIDERKVGRADIQKLQGALTDLSVDKGIFASATDYTKPAEKYAASSLQNPLQKPIELFHIRPSIHQDETGRINKIIINMSMHWANYRSAKWIPVWTKNGFAELEKDGLTSKEISFMIDKFYDKDGSTLITIHDLTKFDSPGTIWEKDFVSKGSWVINGYLKIQDKLYEVKALSYEVPYLVSEEEIVIESEGTPRLFIKNSDGSIDKLITDKELKRVQFVDGRINVEPQ